MPDNHYENPRLVSLYDLDSPWSIERDFYLSLAALPHQSILDLGCGTGLLCNAYAENGHNVTGVDPSSAMLDAGRRKPQGDKIEWVQSLAQTYRSDQLFDLIVMTGHAFQVLLTDADISATFAVMQSHLKPSGLVAFESRNPAIDWATRWHYDLFLQLPAGIVRESRTFLGMEDGRTTFELRYQFPEQTLKSVSSLRFLCRSEIEMHLAASGLRVEKLLGGWNAQPFDETSSLEMIFMARASRSAPGVSKPDQLGALAWPARGQYRTSSA